MNILIVDDNANNRMMIKLVLEDYQEDKKINFDIKEACDGQEAIDMCQNENFDIVYMDIMMPNIDGIEATKVIKEKNSKIMVIAVSAVDDVDRMKLILNNGAEDYISKPINTDIFLSRLENYISIIGSREHRIQNINKINVYTSKVFNRYTKFNIDSENSLAEFWECFLFDSNEKFDDISDVVRTVFAIAEVQFKFLKHCEIYVEESEQFQFFSVVNMEKIPLKVIKLLIAKNQSDLEYKIEGDTLSFKLYKINTISDESSDIKTDTVSETKPTNIDETNKIISTGFKKSKEELVVFDYIENEDMSDLQEYSSNLNSLMLIAGSGDLMDDEIVEIYSYLDRIGALLSSYSEVYPISVALNSLASEMSNHQEDFAQKSELLGPMCKAFANDMSTWIEMSFKTGAPSVDFMNDTIVVNCQTISAMLTMDDNVSDKVEDIDDIFDF